MRAMWAVGSARGRSCFALAAICAGLVMAGTPVRAAPETLDVAYDLYLGGFQLGKAEMTADVDAASYSAHSTMRTAGVADALFKSRYVVHSSGIIDGGRVTPLSYDSEFRGRKKKYQLVKLAYEGLDPGPTWSDPEYGDRLTLWPVSPGEKRGTVDPLSAILFILLGSSVEEDAPCGGVVPIFDGRRRYNLELSHLGEESITVRRGKVHKGPALHCDMQYRRIAGFKGGQDDDALPIPPLKAWIARRHGGRYLVPVRVTAETPFGDVVLILNRFRVSPKVQSAEADECAPEPASSSKVC